MVLLNVRERDKMPEDIADIELPELKAIAAAHGVHPAVICIKWAVQRGASPIPFSLKEKNYTMNLKCVTEDPLTEEEMETIRSLDKNNRLNQRPCIPVGRCKGLARSLG